MATNFTFQNPCLCVAEPCFIVPDSLTIGDTNILTNMVKYMTECQLQN